MVNSPQGWTSNTERKFRHAYLWFYQDLWLFPPRSLQCAHPDYGPGYESLQGERLSPTDGQNHIENYASTSHVYQKRIS